MLTKELLRFTNQKGKLTPRFVDPENRLLLNLAEELLSIYQSGVGMSRADLAEVVKPVLSAHRSLILAKGLDKLALDRCVFKEPEAEVSAFRLSLFPQAAELIRAEGLDDHARYRAALGGRMAMEADLLAERLYADLPIRQPLESPPDITPRALLNRFNLAQVQGPLLWAESLTIETADKDVGRLRIFFRQLKFFRLMARVERLPEGRHRIRIDGPLSIFEQTRKYGFQLASFLPTLPILNDWRLEARVRPPKGQWTTMALDHSAPLVSTLSVTSEHRPESFAVFAEQFAQEAAGRFRIAEPDAIIGPVGGEMVVPDFSFHHGKGKVIHLELFHRWHRGALLNRLQGMAGKGGVSLIAGVERALAKDAVLSPKLAASSWFGRCGFLFNEFPPVKRVLDALEGYVTPS